MRSELPWTTAAAVAVLLFGCDSGAGTSPSGDVASPVDTVPSEDIPSMDARPEVPAGCVFPGTAGATARCLSPTKSEDYYVAQGLLYFDTLDIDADPANVPNYSLLVARWEWPPWLLLTGYGVDDMIEVSLGLKEVDPSTVPVRDCRFFPVQPFARCYVEFEYAHGPCPIYEEFTFNDQGEMTFIEAWSDLPGLLPNGAEDRWAEAPDFPRLSTRIPGLGNETGRIDPDSEWMQQVAAQDPEVADFALRITDWWKYWFEALGAADEDFFAQGCGW